VRELEGMARAMADGVWCGVVLGGRGCLEAIDALRGTHAGFDVQTFDLLPILG